MGKILYFSALTAMVLSYASTFGQGMSGIEAICTLNRTASKAMEKIDVPFGAQHKKEIVWRKESPNDFQAVLALMQGVSVAPCGMQEDQEAKIAIRAIRLIERDPSTGMEQVVSTVTDFSTKKRDQTVFDGELFPRSPKWYVGSSSKPGSDMLGLENDSLIIDLGKSPNFVYHGWTDPKVATKPGMNYLVEMEVKISGLARLQMGVDYWRETSSAFNTFDSTCEKSNNCEGYLSHWFGPTDGWQTLRAPESFDGK